MNNLEYLVNPSYGAKFAVANRTNQLKEAGFTSSEAIEMLMVEGVDYELAKTAADGLYGIESIKVASNESENIIDVVPTSYDKVRRVIEKSLFQTNTPRKFVDKIARSNNPIVPCNKEALDLLYRLANNAQYNDSDLRQLHAFLEPYVEEKILNSVENYENNSVRIAQVETTDNGVVEDKYEYNEVNLREVKCTCKPFNEGNYQEFGIPCEHIICFAQESNPYIKAKRKIN